MNNVLSEISKASSLKPLSLGKRFVSLRKLLEKEQKELVFNKKSRREEKEYFNFIKFLFSSPDKKYGEQI